MTATTHLQRKPNARGSTIAQKGRQDAVTEQLRREIAENSRPRREGAVRCMMRGIAALVARIPV